MSDRPSPRLNALQAALMYSLWLQRRLRGHRADWHADNHRHGVLYLVIISTVAFGPAEGAACRKELEYQALAITYRLRSIDETFEPPRVF